MRRSSRLSSPGFKVQWGTTRKTGLKGVRDTELAAVPAVVKGLAPDGGKRNLKELNRKKERSVGQYTEKGLEL